MEMIRVRGARKNLQSVGWENFILQAEFRGGRRYQYGGVPVEVRDRLIRVPFPDRLFTQIVKGKYTCERIDTPPSKPAPKYPIDYDLLPF